jgi:High-temperature-induced dauer-formation protein
LRVLQRVLPVVFEAQGDSNTFESELLWKREAETEDGQPVTEPQFVIEDEDESDREGNTAESTTIKTKTKWLPSLGERLLTSITDLLFCCGFTLPKTIQVDHHKINYVIWYVIEIEFKMIPWFITSSKGKRALDRLLT